jgi:hypothetical protein
MEKLWKIQELCTTGWEDIDPEDCRLTKEQCDKRLEHYMNNEWNPNRLRAVPDGVMKSSEEVENETKDQKYDWGNIS